MTQANRGTKASSSAGLRVRRMTRLLLKPSQPSQASDGSGSSSPHHHAEDWGYKLTSLGAALVLAGLVSFGHALWH